MKVAIIGAGAAGCFCAIQMKRLHPDYDVNIFESASKPLLKVSVTGGGRCNVTNSFEHVPNLGFAYPRGERLIKRAFGMFDYKDTYKWFEDEGVPLVTQEDGCVFPKAQDAMAVVNMLVERMSELGVKQYYHQKVARIRKSEEGGYSVIFDSMDVPDFQADVVVVTTGGQPRPNGFRMLEDLNLEIVPPVPSLFTFNLPGSPVRDLMGTVVEKAGVSIVGTKFKAQGALLITHWGMSGPAVLRLSSYSAPYLAENDYKVNLSVNWLGDANENDVRGMITALASSNSQKNVANVHPSQIPSRLWDYLIRKIEIRENAKWGELGSKSINRLVNLLINDTYQVHGKGKFKDEFVTCGGVALKNISLNTLEAKEYPNLYFAGEILDVDAITGGFNLQAAWSMGYVVANSVR